MLSTEDGNRTTHEDEGRIQVLVVLFHVISVILSRFPAVHGEEVGPRVIGPERIEKFPKGGMETGFKFGRQRRSDCHGNRTDWAHHFGSIWTTTGSCD